MSYAVRFSRSQWTSIVSERHISSSGVGHDWQVVEMGRRITCWMI